jgi:hypothetical protein
MAALTITEILDWYRVLHLISLIVQAVLGSPTGCEKTSEMENGQRDRGR